MHLRRNLSTASVGTAGIAVASGATLWMTPWARAASAPPPANGKVPPAANGGPPIQTTPNVEPAKRETPQSALVVGSGIQGLATAYFLSQSGLRVTVVDSSAGPGLMCSFANAGSMSVSTSIPVPNRRNLRQVLKATFLPTRKSIADPSRPWESFQYFRVSLATLLTDRSFWRWGWHYIRSCLDIRNGQARRQHSWWSLSQFSVDCFKQLLTTEGLDCEIVPSSLVLARNQQQLEALVQRYNEITHAEDGRFAGTCVLLRGSDSVVQREPWLQPVADSLYGALEVSDEFTVDSRRFLLQLYNRLQRAAPSSSMLKGMLQPLREDGGTVEFRFGTRVTKLEQDTKSRSITNVHLEPVVKPKPNEQVDASQQKKLVLSRGSDFDVVVLCAGSMTPDLVRPLGARLPVYAGKGYSLTIPIAPTSPSALASAGPRQLVSQEGLYITPFFSSKNADNVNCLTGIRFASVMDLRSRNSPRPDLGCVDAFLSLIRGSVPAASLLPPEQWEALRANIRTAVKSSWKAKRVTDPLAPEAVNTWQSSSPHATLWMGQRPLSPDGFPIVGPCVTSTLLRRSKPIDGLYVLTGHGMYGFQHAVSTASFVVDHIFGRPLGSTAGIVLFGRDSEFGRARLGDFDPGFLSHARFSLRPPVEPSQ